MVEAYRAGDVLLAAERVRLDLTTHAWKDEQVCGAWETLRLVRIRLEEAGASQGQTFGWLTNPTQAGLEYPGCSCISTDECSTTGPWVGGGLRPYPESTEGIWMGGVRTADVGG